MNGIKSDSVITVFSDHSVCRMNDHPWVRQRQKTVPERRFLKLTLEVHALRKGFLDRIGPIHYRAYLFYWIVFLTF